MDCSHKFPQIQCRGNRAARKNPCGSGSFKNQKQKWHALTHFRSLGVMYAGDFGEKFPPINTGWFGNTAHPNLWHFELMNSLKYITSSTVSNNLWRCPAVKDSDIAPAATLNYFNGNPLEGYRPFEGNAPDGTQRDGVLRYGYPN